MVNKSVPFIRHINSKLGVERRTQAVARAKELGVLV
jgi:LuxR family maltose regulon positive regulatory protein